MDQRESSRRLRKLTPVYSSEDLEKTETVLREVRRQERLSSKEKEPSETTEDSFATVEGTSTLGHLPTIAQSAITVQQLINQAAAAQTETHTHASNTSEGDEDSILDQVFDARTSVRNFCEELESVSSGTRVPVEESEDSVLISGDPQSFPKVGGYQQSSNPLDPDNNYPGEPTVLPPGRASEGGGRAFLKVESGLVMAEKDEEGLKAAELSRKYLHHRFKSIFDNVPPSMRAKIQATACDFDQYMVKLKSLITSLDKEIDDARDAVLDSKDLYPEKTIKLKKFFEDGNKDWQKLDTTGDQLLSMLSAVKMLLDKPDEMATVLRNEISVARFKWQKCFEKFEDFQLRADKYKDDQKASKDVLPKIQLSTFSGNPEAFLSWKSTIENHVLSKQISEQDKAIIIKNSLGGAARKAMQSYQTSNGSKDLMEQLTQQFGNPDRLRTMYMSRLMNLEKMPEDSTFAEIRRFVNYISHVVEVGEEIDLNLGPQFVNLLAMKLPRPFMREVLRPYNGLLHSIDMKTFLEACTDQLAQEQALIPIRSRSQPQILNTNRQQFSAQNRFFNQPRNYAPQWSAAAGFNQQNPTVAGQTRWQQPGRQNPAINQNQPYRPQNFQSRQNAPQPANQQTKYQPGYSNQARSAPNPNPSKFHCTICKELKNDDFHHREISCPDFNKLDSKGRREMAKRFNLCFKCCSKDCKRRQFCRNKNIKCTNKKPGSDMTCGFSHHYLLCPEMSR